MEQDNNNKVDVSKIIWNIQLETASGIIYYSQMSYDTVRTLKKAMATLTQPGARGIIDRFLMPYVLEKHKEEEIKTLHISRATKDE